MTTAHNVQGAFRRYLRSHIVIALRDIRKGEQGVQIGHNAGTLLDALNLRGELLSHFLKEFKLQSEELFLGAQYALFELPELLGRVALCVCERLPPLKVIRNLREEGIRDLKIITEDLIVLDL